MKRILSGILLYAGMLMLALPQTGSTQMDPKSPRMAILTLTGQSRTAPRPCEEWIRQPMDPAGSVPVRLEAVRSLVATCRERPSLMQEFS